MSLFILSTLVAIITVTLLCLVVLILYHIYLPPTYLIRTLCRLYPTVLFHLPTSKPILVLTIDDTPSADTARIAEILQAHDVRASFFVIGSHIPGHETTLRSLVAQGHELANHAMYDAPSFRLADQTLEREILEVEARLTEIYRFVDPTAMSTRQVPPRYFRPGSGFFTARMLARLSSLSYRCVLGSIYPHDAQIYWPSLNAWHILRSVRPGGFIICHDRPWTPQMLEVILPELQKRGFSVGSVAEATKWAAAAPPRGDGAQARDDAQDERVKRT